MHSEWKIAISGQSDRLVLHQGTCIIYSCICFCALVLFATTARSIVFVRQTKFCAVVVEPSWNVMAHGDAWVGKWRGNWRMEWVANTLRTTSEHGVSSITTADAHTSAVSSRLNWRPRRFKWTRPFRRKAKSGFCACAIISNGLYS